MLCDLWSWNHVVRPLVMEKALSEPATQGLTEPSVSQPRRTVADSQPQSLCPSPSPLSLSLLASPQIDQHLARSATNKNPSSINLTAPTASCHFYRVTWFGFSSRISSSSHQSAPPFLHTYHPSSAISLFRPYVFPWFQSRNSSHPCLEKFLDSCRSAVCQPSSRPVPVSLRCGLSGDGIWSLVEAQSERAWSLDMTGRIVDSSVTSNGDLKVQLMYGGVHVNGMMGVEESRNGFHSIADTAEFDDEDEESSSGDDDKSWNYAQEVTITQIDDRDVGTSDDWIPRHPDLVRLTGRHPFNCEPPLSTLMEAGFLTPTSLHYVRNHGAVPRASWDDWKIDVTGLVKRPMTFTMSDILRFPAHELPVTLVCAGNRRKEENMVKQSIGFNWGAAAVSTSIWKGVHLCDVLRHCGVLSRKKGALYVCFEGAEILPGGGGSTYGTSITINTAMDRAEDVLLAYQQNGKDLEPDHGYPIRLLIPGYIGGRMVKWLKKIVVTSQESGNYYHFHDNRVLPSHVDAETAKAEGWWYRPDYIINQLNINSAISSPGHGETLPVNFSTLQEPYIVKGYAYSGGGRKVTRVEVSLDDGKSWKLCDLKHPEEPTKYGKYWCWCFWQLGVDVMDLLKCKEISVRAWDAAMNTQPQHLIWNVMGMMNNSWFRVKIGMSKSEDNSLHLTFEHPTRPGNQTGGWMVKAAAPEAVPANLNVKVAAVAAKPSRQIKLSEVRKHQKEDSCWIIVRNKVYDCTPFLEDHPGGADSILINGGMDSTEEFDAIHSAKAQAMLEEYYIGELVASKDDLDAAPADQGKDVTVEVLSASGKPVALNPKERIPFTLIEREVLSHDVRRLRFALQSPNHVLGLPVGKHILLSASINGKFCMRAYTPTSNDEDVGYVELVIKVYFQNAHSKFPLGGLFSQYLDSLKLGDTIDVKGPVGHIVYKGKGQFLIGTKPKFVKKIAMLAGGTGITPMYQVIRAIVSDPEDKTEINLLYSNRNMDDIMLKKELDAWQAKHKNFRVCYTLTGANVPEDWQCSKGRISEAMVKQHLPPGCAESLALLCGPPELIQLACLPSLLKHKYEKGVCLEF